MISFLFRQIHSWIFRVQGVLTSLLSRFVPYLPRLTYEQSVQTTSQQVKKEEKATLLDILPDDILKCIFTEWATEVSDLIAFDTAVCNRNFRSSRYEKCLLYSLKPVVTTHSADYFQKFICWQIGRKIKTMGFFTSLYQLWVRGNHPLLSLEILKYVDNIEKFLYYLDHYVYCEKNSVRFTAHISISAEFPFLQSLTLENKTIYDHAPIISWIFMYCAQLKKIELKLCNGISVANVISLIQEHKNLRDLTFFAAEGSSTRPTIDTFYRILEREKLNGTPQTQLERLIVQSHDGSDLLDIVSVCSNLKELWSVS
jgi:hypothetical protein